MNSEGTEFSPKQVGKYSRSEAAVFSSWGISGGSLWRLQGRQLRAVAPEFTQLHAGITQGAFKKPRVPAGPQINQIQLAGMQPRCPSFVKLPGDSDVR